MSIIIPALTDVDLDYPASVNFIASGKGSVNINSIVSFVHAGGNSGIPLQTRSGSSVAVSQNTSSNILTVVVGSNGGFLTGIEASGDTNGEYSITVNNVNIGNYFTNIINMYVDYQFPGAVTLYNGDVVTISCLNTGDVASNYNATLFGAF